MCGCCLGLPSQFWGTCSAIRSRPLSLSPSYLQCSARFSNHIPCRRRSRESFRFPSRFVLNSYGRPRKKARCSSRQPHSSNPSTLASNVRSDFFMETRTISLSASNHATCTKRYPAQRCTSSQMPVTWCIMPIQSSSVRLLKLIQGSVGLILVNSTIRSKRRTQVRLSL